MIEIIMSLIVAVVCILGVISLFPIGIKKNAQSSNVSGVSDSTEQFLHLMASAYKTNPNMIKVFPVDKNDVDSHSLTWSDTLTDPATQSQPLIYNDQIRILFPLNDPTDTAEVFDPATHTQGVFKLQQLTKVDGVPRLDFECIMRVWQSEGSIVLHVDGCFPPELPDNQQDCQSNQLTIADPKDAGDFPCYDIDDMNDVFSCAIFNDSGEVKFTNLQKVMIDGNVRAETGRAEFGNVNSLMVSGTVDASLRVRVNNCFGTIAGDVTSAQNLALNAGVDYQGTNTIVASIGDFSLPTLAAPVDANDPNYAQPIQIITGDHTISGSVELEGTIYATGKIHIQSGTTISGTGAIVAGDEIHLNSIDSVGGEDSNLFFYALGNKVHFNNVANVTVNGIIYAPAGGIHLNNVNEVSIDGGLYTGGGDQLINNITSFNVRANPSNNCAIPPGIVSTF